MFKRYADPLSLMKTYSLQGLADFVLQMFDKENEEEIWQTWLHKERQLNFADFKRKYFKKMHKTKVQALSKEEEERIIKNATRFIKPINKGGEDN